MRAFLIRILTASAIVAATGAITACTSEDSPPAATMGHVHGLGIDPADGVLYAGAHNGVFRVTAGVATRVGDGDQDMMGFTVIGARHFLASGHSRGADLGLIESTDGGTGWKALSLSGTVDFHILRYAHGTVYGYDSRTETVMASSDKVNWQKRAPGPPLRDFAVDPSDPDVLVGTIGEALMRSDDGGRTWTDLSGPELVLLDWRGPEALIGVTAGGTVYTSADRGAAWQRAGSSGEQPTALTGLGDTLFLALRSGAILRSTDRGRTWSEFLRPVEQAHEEGPGDNH